MSAELPCVVPSAAQGSPMRNVQNSRKFVEFIANTRQSNQSLTLVVKYLKYLKGDLKFLGVTGRAVEPKAQCRNWIASCSFPSFYS